MIFLYMGYEFVFCIDLVRHKALCQTRTVIRHYDGQHSATAVMFSVIIGLSSWINGQVLSLFSIPVKPVAVTVPCTTPYSLYLSPSSDSDHGQGALFKQCAPVQHQLCSQSPRDAPHTLLSKLHTVNHPEHPNKLLLSLIYMSDRSETQPTPQ